MENIILVGFMGTGKTVIAKALAKRLNAKYVSTDDLIEKKEKTSISDIFSKRGEGYFRKVEKEIVQEVAAMKNVVVDAGGGVMLDPENVNNLQKSGYIICLWAEPEIILERTKRYTHRPLLNVANPLEKIKELIALRRPFYERADYHIHTSQMTVEEVVNEIERIINEAADT